MGGGVETTLKKTPGSYYRAVQYTVLASQQSLLLMCVLFCVYQALHSLSLYYIPPIFFILSILFISHFLSLPSSSCFPFHLVAYKWQLGFFLYFCLSLFSAFIQERKEIKIKKKLSMMFDTRKGVSAPWLMLKYTGRGENKNTTKNKK